MIITTLMAKNVYEQDDHYQSGAKKGVRTRDQFQEINSHMINSYSSNFSRDQQIADQLSL